jgi:peptide/nickel transport system permease protein
MALHTSPTGPGTFSAEGGASLVSQAKAPAGRSPGQLAWRRFRRDTVGVISCAVVLFFFVLGLSAPVISWLYGKDPHTTYGQNRAGLLTDAGYPIKPNGGMDSEFWFGLEPHNGRDVLMQLVYGIRTSLLLAIAVTIIVTVIGTTIGIMAGYLGGRTDFVVSRVIDVLLSFPSLLFMLAFIPVVWAMFVSPNEETPTWLRASCLIAVLSIFGWTRIARLLRGQVLSLREREFIDAARVAGASSRRVIVKELLPNLWTPILVLVTLDLPAYVTLEAALSYLGVGMAEPTPDWGRMIHNGADVYVSDITYLVFPGAALLVFVLAFNLLGDSLRDALDPKGGR